MIPTVVQSDLPDDIAILKQLPSLRGTDGKFTIIDCFKELRISLQSNEGPIVIEAPTGCGKSKKLPSFVCKCISQLRYEKPLLVITSAAIDVFDMYKNCEYPAQYRIGRGRKSMRDENPWCVFVTIGVAARWYANKNIECLSEYSGVVFDELHASEKYMNFFFFVQESN